MPQPTLEERVAALEAAMERLLAQSTSAPAAQGWRSTLGMFANDPIMQEIDEEGRKIREADRKQVDS
jgi:hypothetical protein